jgi:hypothetical protein
MDVKVRFASVARINLVKSERIDAVENAERFKSFERSRPGVWAWLKEGAKRTNPRQLMHAENRLLR